jgi:hypothetical protein
VRRRLGDDKNALERNAFLWAANRRKQSLQKIVTALNKSQKLLFEELFVKRERKWAKH